MIRCITNKANVAKVDNIEDIFHFQFNFIQNSHQTEYIKS